MLTAIVVGLPLALCAAWLPIETYRLAKELRAATEAARAARTRALAARLARSPIGDALASGLIEERRARCATA